MSALAIYRKSIGERCRAEDRINDAMRVIDEAAALIGTYSDEAEAAVAQTYACWAKDNLRKLNEALMGGVSKKNGRAK